MQGTTICCLGLSHRTATLEVRERFALGFDGPGEVLSELRSLGHVHEAVWLSTCNRVELYAVVDDRVMEQVAGRGERGGAQGDEDKGGDLGVRASWRATEQPSLHSWFRRRPGLGDSAISNALYCIGSPRSVEHLYRVASGLDSMVLGETEVLGQLKDAYELSRRSGHVGRILNPIFQGAFRTAKQVRSETGIQRGAVSIASLAAELAEETFGSLSGRSVLVLGAGDTGAKVTRSLLDRGAGDVRIVNRSEERGRALAATLGPKATALPEWSGSLAQVDVVISCTSSPEFVLDRGRLEPVIGGRRDRPLLMLDLAVPRDIEPGVGAMPGVRLHNIDDLQALAEAHLKRRQSEVGRCEKIIRKRVWEVLQRVATSGGGPGRMAG